MALTVGEVAELAGVSVRTLHHYDEQGLVRPSGRSESRYRLYEDADLERLRQVLFFRELEFPLEEIKRLLDAPEYDIGTALRMQRALLAEKVVRLQALMGAVEQAIEAREKGRTMTKEEMFEVFGDFNPSDYEEEAWQRWGDTDAWKESAKRTARYTKKDWEQLKAESGAISEQFVALMRARKPADDAAAMDAAEAHRQHISKWFYPCPKKMHAGLGDLYVNDPRFTANIDRAAPGLSAYMREAMRANAARK